MVANAMDYQDELRKAFYAIWYDPKYQYYFCSYLRRPLEFDDGGGKWPRRDFVSLDESGKLLGYISYAIDTAVKLAYGFGAINFSENKTTFGRDLRTVVDDIFMKFGMETFEFSVIIGNPVERNYDRMVHKIGGRILCIRHARAQDLAGNVCNDKVYEITREEYLHFRSREEHGNGSEDSTFS